MNDDIDLGRSGTTDRLSTDRDIRACLEDRSTDVELSAFALLVRPTKPWLANILNEDERRDLGAIAIERYCETRSVAPYDYADLLEHVVDPFSFEWSPARRSPPIGCMS